MIQLSLRKENSVSVSHFPIIKNNSLTDFTSIQLKFLFTFLIPFLVTLYFKVSLLYVIYTYYKNNNKLCIIT